MCLSLGPVARTGDRTTGGEGGIAVDRLLRGGTERVERVPLNVSQLLLEERPSGLVHPRPLDHPRLGLGPPLEQGVPFRPL